jgi:hypothetical protein
MIRVTLDKSKTKFDAPYAGWTVNEENPDFRTRLWLIAHYHYGNPEPF